MAKIRILVDTDIFIDYLRGIRTAKTLFSSEEVEVYYSVLTKKELLSKVGLKYSERKKILRLLSQCKAIKIDNNIAGKFSLLLNRYGDRPEWAPDLIIAATTWSKNLPLLTRNIKHFKFIKEIKLAPSYYY